MATSKVNKMELAALPRVSANLPPYTPNKSTLAFGVRAIPKIVSPSFRTDMILKSVAWGAVQ